MGVTTTATRHATPPAPPTWLASTFFAHAQSRTGTPHPVCATCSRRLQAALEEDIRRVNAQTARYEAALARLVTHDG